MIRVTIELFFGTAFLGASSEGFFEVELVISISGMDGVWDWAGAESCLRSFLRA